MEVSELEKVTVDLEADNLPACYGREVHPSGMDACAQCPFARACYAAWVAGLPVKQPVEPQSNGTNGKH